MKERLITLGLALSALSVFYALFLPKPAPADGAPAAPLSTEKGPNGYQAAWRWLRAAQVPLAALHERYDRLQAGDASRAATGNVLLTVLPHKVTVAAAEDTQLDAWVERGNTLVVMAALDDTPLWALMQNARLIATAGRLTRLKFEVIEPEQPGANRPSFGAKLHGMLESENSVIEPRGAHPLLEGVRSVKVISDLPASRWRATPMERSGMLQIGQVTGNHDPAIWLRRQGLGQVIVFACASVFSNKAIGELDNARLLSNIVAWSRGPRGAVIFDDAHQGVVSYYDAKAFFADPRLHRTLAWIVLLWFVFVLGAQRLRTRTAGWNPADVTAFVGVSGEFFASTLPPAVAGARLLANFFNSIRRRIGLPEDGAAVWEWLSKQAGITASQLAELRLSYDRVQAGRSVSLIRLQNLLSEMQGNLI